MALENYWIPSIDCLYQKYWLSTISYKQSFWSSFLPKFWLSNISYSYVEITRGYEVQQVQQTRRYFMGIQFRQIGENPVCALGDVEMWLAKLPCTIFFVDMAEWQTPALLEILGKFPLLTRNRWVPVPALPIWPPSLQNLFAAARS